MYLLKYSCGNKPHIKGTAEGDTFDEIQNIVKELQNSCYDTFAVYAIKGHFNIKTEISFKSSHSKREPGE